VIRHLLKLVWNRKRANALIIAEIFLSFIVVFAVLAGVLAFWSNWRKPLGYDYRDVWVVEMDFDIDARDPDNPKLREMVRQMVAEAKTFPEVEAVGGSNTPPYNFSTSEGGWQINGKRVRIMFDDVTDGFADVMKMKPTRGRWFTAEDDAAAYQAVVIDENTARALYPNEDPIGKKFDADEERPRVVVGIVPGYRKNGEMAQAVNMVFQRVGLQKPMGRLGSSLLVRVRPGTPAEFEARLMKRLEAIGPAVSMRLARMDRMRVQAHRVMAAPVVVGGIIALFLISMVALGLTGILWQSVTRRTREIGVRRAMGASGPGVHTQILLEVILLTTLALIVGVIVVWQLPLLGIFAVVPPPVFTLAFAISLAAIYMLTVACGLYPSWLASRLTPADALRYE
jgi:putative ABC transport system permease protein